MNVEFVEALIVFAVYGIEFLCACIVGAGLMYLLCEGIEKAIEILNGDVDG